MFRIKKINICKDNLQYKDNLVQLGLYFHSFDHHFNLWYKQEMRAVELETNIKVRQNILDDGRQNIIQTFCRHIQLNPVGQTVMGAFSDFLDKLIALCDYYLSKKVSSRILRSLFLSSILPKTQRLSALCELKWRKAPSSAFQRLKLETCDVVSTICTWKNQNNDSPACTHLIFCNNKKTFQYFFFF